MQSLGVQQEWNEDFGGVPCNQDDMAPQESPDVWHKTYKMIGIQKSLQPDSERCVRPRYSAFFSNDEATSFGAWIAGAAAVRLDTSYQAAFKRVSDVGSIRIYPPSYRL